MLSPIPEILDKPQYIDVVAKFILEGSVSRSPDVYRGYRVRRVAITKSNRVQKVFHQTLVLEVEDGEGNHPSILHLLVAERCTIPCDYPKKREAQSYQAGGQDVPARVGSPRPGWNPSSASSDSTRDSLNIPYGDGRDSIRFLKSVYTPVKEFWNNTKGNPSSEFTAKSGVVFDFAGCPREAACSLTLHDVILAMNAVSLVAPRYQFVSTNCWWWAQCVLLLLLRLQFSEGPSLTLSDVQESERFFEKIENPRVLMQYPKYLRLRVTLNEELILRDTTRALAEFRALGKQAAKALEGHYARARLHLERDAAEARANAEADRANSAIARADTTARQLEAARAEIENLKAARVPAAPVQRHA